VLRQVYNIFFKQSSLKLQRIEKAVELLTLSSQGAPKSMEEASKKRYQFWETQPVPKISKYSSVTLHQSHKWGSHCRDRMVIGFTTTYILFGAPWEESVSNSTAFSILCNFKDDCLKKILYTCQHNCFA
jgi:hypothetical protein